MSSILSRAGSQVSRQSTTATSGGSQKSSTKKVGSLPFPSPSSESDETTHPTQSESNTASLSVSGPANRDSSSSSSNNNNAGAQHEPTQQEAEQARRKALRARLKKYAPKFLRNRLANLNLSQDGLRSALVERLLEATLLLEKGVAPTTHAQATGEEVEVVVAAARPTTSENVPAGSRELSAAATEFDRRRESTGLFSGDKDINSPLRASKHQEALKKYRDELASRPAPSKAQTTSAARRKYASQTFRNRIQSTHEDMQKHEMKERAAELKAQETAAKIRADQEHQARLKIERAEAAEVARKRRIEMHGGIDPLQPEEKDRGQLVQAIRDELEEYSTKQLRNMLALKGLKDRQMVKVNGVGGATWEKRTLLREGVLDLLHNKLVEERLGPDDDILVNALIVLGLDPGKTTFTAKERKKLQREVARLTREKLARQQAAMREEMAKDHAQALARLKEQEMAAKARRNNEVARVHEGMQDVAREQRLEIHRATQSIHPLRVNHFDSLPNGFPKLNEFLPDDYVESDVEKYAKQKERDVEKEQEATAMRAFLRAVDPHAIENRRAASESHFVPNTKSDFLYGNLVVNESLSRNIGFGTGDAALAQKPARYVGPVWRERPVPPPKKVYSRGEVMSMLFWGVYKGSIADVRKAIPLIDWNNGIDFQFEVGAGMNHPAAAHGDTALHIAARQGHSRVVRELINNGADHQIKNKDLMTAFDVVRATNTSKMPYERRNAFQKIFLLLGKLRGDKMKFVTEWLSTLKGSGAAGVGLEQYAEQFEKQGYDDLKVIAMLSKDGIDKLVADVGMTNRGHTNRLTRAIAIKNLEMTGQITAEEAALKVQQLSDTRAKATSKTKVKYNSPFEDDLLNGNRELQKAMRRQRIQEEKARRGGGGERVRGEQDTRCHNWRFRQDIEREEKEAAGLLEAASEASKPRFKEVYPVGYDPPDPTDKSSGGYPMLKWSERRKMNKRRSGFH